MKVFVRSVDGVAIKGSAAVVWGNNAAWICVSEGCLTLHGGRTADNETLIDCDCGTRYEILRSENRNGLLNLGPAIGVQILSKK